MNIKRTCMDFLLLWLTSKRRQPLVIRGARQVGKTWVVRHLAQVAQLKLIEINLEDNPKFASFFTSNDPHTILQDIENGLQMNKIDQRTSLLFLDELQVAPELYAKLRWFAEKMPELAIIGAGSLFEFMFDTAKRPYSMPVGRVEFMYLEPLSFEEFLYALDKPQLVRLIKEYTWRETIPEYTHELLIKLFKEYVIVGGMPAAVRAWIEDTSLLEVSRIHQKILTTYKEDFHKYAGRLDPSLLEDTLERIPLDVGKKFVYSKVRQKTQSEPIKKALNLLCKARVCHKVISTDAHGIPLHAEKNEKFIKAILLDVGLCSAELKLTLKELKDLDELILVNSGGIAEQVVGQLLRTIEPLFIDPSLYYWRRHAKDAEAKIDYVIQHGHNVVPLEVKAGKPGQLKSLHTFMGRKKLTLAARVYSGKPLQQQISTKDPYGQPLKYELRSLPFYLMSELSRLLD